MSSRNALIILWLCLWALPAQGLELYRLLGKDCQGDAGLIINADQEGVEILSLEGEIKRVERAQVEHILIYNSLETPITKINLNGALGARLREIQLDYDGREGLTGWPIKFVEDLVIFFDLEGKTSLLAIDKIVKISASPVPLGEVELTQQGEKTELILGNALAQCTEAPRPGLYPTRTISDQIRISQFFSTYQKGFERLSRFQSRTRFYAKPFVFDRETKLGLPLMAPGREQEIPGQFPFYFQWSAGRPYSHQGLTVLGTKPNEWLPQVEPIFVMQTDLKSHFFNASFGGNPLALSAGSNYLVASRTFVADYVKKVATKEASLTPSFNYYAMSGIDYGPWSVAGGAYYPIYGVGAGGLFREVLPTRASPMARLLYQQARWRFKAIWSASNYSSGSPTKLDLRLATMDELAGSGLVTAQEAVLITDLTRFDLNARYLRLGVDQELNDQVQYGVDAIRVEVDYSETYQGWDQNYQARNWISRAFVKQKFGSYVELRGQVNLFWRQFDLVYFGKTSRFSEQQYSLIGSIEFII